jgi:FtsP/CotA-like multicopper oxidase with cupredoxin domain
VPWRIVEGVKIYHFIAKEIRHELPPPRPGRQLQGYNGSVHGPTIEAVEGDRVRFHVTDRLGAPTTRH